MWVGGGHHDFQQSNSHIARAFPGSEFVVANTLVGAK